jgi:hypothetical protein
MDVLAHQFVRADGDIDAAFSKPGDGVGGFLAGAEAREWSLLQLYHPSYFYKRFSILD